MNAGSDWPSSRALETRRDCEADPPMISSEGLSLGNSLGDAAAEDSQRRASVVGYLIERPLGLAFFFSRYRCPCASPSLFQSWPRVRRKAMSRIRLTTPTGFAPTETNRVNAPALARAAIIGGQPPAEPPACRNVMYVDYGRDEA